MFNFYLIDNSLFIIALTPSTRTRNSRPTDPSPLHNIYIIYNNNMKEQRFNNKVLDGEKGRLMLEIAKTFKGDKRFQLDQRF